MGAHVIAAEKMGIPRSLKETFSILCREGIIDQRLCRLMENMCGFRNIAVHDYNAIDIRILETILEKHLTDLEDLYVAVLSHFDIA